MIILNKKAQESLSFFVHGSYATTSTWKKMVEHLSKTHLCISIKLPGHCGTPDPADFSNPCVETELSIIEHVVAELTAQPIHLVGHSYGGVVALAQLTIPTRLVCGSQSNQLVHAIVNHLNKEVPDSKKYEIEGANHFLVTSHAEECLSVLQGALNL